MQEGVIRPLEFRFVGVCTSLFDDVSYGRWQIREHQVNEVIVRIRCPKSLRINPAQRIPIHIAKPIPPPIQPNRVALRIAACARIVRAEVVVMQPALFIKVLPRIAQVEAHGRDVGGARRGVGGFVREPFCPQRGGFVPVGGVGPLPGGLPVGLRQAPGCAQVVGVDGVQAVVDLCGHGDRPLGCGQIDVLALPCALCAAHAVFAQEAAVFVVQVSPAQVLCIALGGVPQAGEEVHQGLQQAGVFFLVVQGAVFAAGCGEQGLGLEDALAQGVVRVAGGGGVWALACLAALQAALAVVVVLVQAVGLQVACGVVLVGDAGVGGAAGAGAGLAEAQEFVVAAFCAVAAGGGGSGAFALAAGEVAVGVVLVGGGVGGVALGIAPGAAQRAGDASKLEAKLGSGA